MNEGPQGRGKTLGEGRQAAVEALCEHFARDAMPVEEFERRVDLAHRAASMEELRELLADLPGDNLPAPSPRHRAPATPSHERAGAVHRREREIVLAIMGGATRKGRWTPARHNYAFSVMGGTLLDFREADLPRGVTEVQVFTVMGGTDIIVPPGVIVESHGVGIMGAFDHLGDDEAYGPDAPILRITGLALMGGVDITVRLPGESARDARRRRKLEQKERKRLRGSWD